MEALTPIFFKYWNILEKCTEAKQSLAREILESFNSLIDEIRFASKLDFGVQDTINVQEELIQDFLAFNRQIQPKEQEHVEPCLRKLQGVKEKQLRSLQNIISLWHGNPKAVDEEELKNKVKTNEIKGVNEFLTMILCIIQGITEVNPDDNSITDIVKKMKEHREIYSFRNESNLVKEINKRNLGKMIIRYVGHEGLEEKAGLRCLLQACIDFLQTEAGGVWKNASITIFDEDFNKYEIASGTKTHQFICRMKNGKPFIKEEKQYTHFFHCTIF